MKKTIIVILILFLPLVISCGTLKDLADKANPFSDSSEGNSASEFGAVSQSSGTFGAVMVGASGEMLLPIIDRKGFDPKLTGALWIDTDGGSVTVYFGDNGLPSKTIMGDYVLLFSNWDVDSKTVDIAKIYAPSEYVKIFKGIFVENLSTESNCFPECETDLKNLAELLKFAGLGLSVGACQVATTVSLGNMALPCEGAVVTTATVLASDESWLENLGDTGNILTGTDTFKCTLSNVESCVSLVVDVSGKTLDVADSVLNDNEPIITIADTSLEKPEQQTAVVNQGEGILACPNAYQCSPGADLPCYPEGTKQCNTSCIWGACQGQ